MNIKHLLGKAINAHIDGDAVEVTESLKHAIVEKAREIINENSYYTHVEPQGNGKYLIDEVPVESGETVNVYLTLGRCTPATQGNYSSRASDPEEYYGTSAEIDYTVLQVDRYDEDTGELTELIGAEANAFLDDASHEYISDRLYYFLETKRGGE